LNTNHRPVRMSARLPPLSILPWVTTSSASSALSQGYLVSPPKPPYFPSDNGQVVVLQFKKVPLSHLSEDLSAGRNPWIGTISCQVNPEPRVSPSPQGGYSPICSPTSSSTTESTVETVLEPLDLSKKIIPSTPSLTPEVEEGLFSRVLAWDDFNKACQDVCLWYTSGLLTHPKSPE